MAASVVHHPESTDAVRELVLEARRRGAQVRVRGASHSVAPAIAPDAGGVELRLDRLRGVVITPEEGGHALVEVGAGCNLGYDRYDPSGTSTWQNSLTEQLDRQGYALDCLGGISHQTVGGFLMTGSAGGSLVHDAGANVVALELVDGRGEVHRVSADDTQPEARDLFEAAGVSVGLLGIVTRVWLRAGPAYDIVGSEVTSTLEDAKLDLLGTSGRDGLVDLFRKHEYSRVLWWPQPGFDRVQIWTASRCEPSSDAERKPFQILGRWDTLFGSLLQTMVGNVDDLGRVPEILTGQDWFPRLERTLTGISRGELLHRPDEPGSNARGVSAENARRIARVVESTLRGVLGSGVVGAGGRLSARQLPRWIGPLTSLFVPDGEKPFRDRWHLALPMDNQLDDRLWPATFSELWVPLERATDVMRCVQEVVEASGDERERYRRVRAFPLEMYPGPKSRFWLSPGYGREGLRVNPARFAQWSEEPHQGVIDTFLEALRPFDPRPHWGKVLPSGNWVEDFHRQLPRLGDFLRLRTQLDPDGVFLTQYWRDHLGIA